MLPPAWRMVARNILRWAHAEFKGGAGPLMLWVCIKWILSGLPVLVSRWLRFPFIINLFLEHWARQKGKSKSDNSVACNDALKWQAPTPPPAMATSPTVPGVQSSWPLRI